MNTNKLRTALHVYWNKTDIPAAIFPEVKP